MSITILAAVTIGLAIIIQFYCIRKAKNNISELFPAAAGKKPRIAVLTALLIFNSYTVLFIFFWLRMTYSAGNYPMSDDLAFNFLVIYPAFIMMLIGIQVGLFLLLFHSLKSILIPAWLNLKLKNIQLEIKLVIGVVIFFLIFIPAKIITAYDIVPENGIEYKKQHQLEEKQEYILKIS